MSLKFSLAIIIVLLGLALIRPSHGAADKAEDYLVPHNKARKDVGLPPLTWSPKLAAYAYSTALAHKDGCKPEYTSTGPFPENVIGGSGPEMTAADATNKWVSQKEFYDPKTQTCAKDKECRHYTNIISSGAHRMGCAKINCSTNDGLLFQCNYSA
ncbi:CAP (Cysteine-rich secretory proteins Antigen 5 and Pathogenesis-related 1 protein) superfamily protein [Euphorbia peplus]|nr:CAP (Cysteine-rich secretory proteins Antigen 5 and Pathogenesis-related 1 protein) superfamily protein [Euphorbia peplus]